MAGIGFELKKLFSKKGVINSFKAITFSAIITIGPSVMSIFMLVVFNILLKRSGVSLLNRELFQCTIMYSFVFSAIITGGLSLLLTRYISDKIYDNIKSDSTKSNKEIRSSLIGVLTIVSLIAFLSVFLFYLFSPLDNLYKVISGILFIEVVIMQILSVYVTSIKKYKIVLYGFFAGIISSILLEIIMLYVFKNFMIISSIISFDVGIMIIILVLLFEIQKYFPLDGGKYFDFLSYFKRYPSLFFINTFYFLGLYVHNFIFWGDNKINRILENTFVYAPIYDVPSFFAFMTSIFANVIFVVKFETSFSNKWSEYLTRINDGASYKDINSSKSNMIFVLKSELQYIMIMQLIITLGSAIFGYKMMSIFGFTASMKDIFNILSLSYYCISIILIAITILLYFDDRRGALLISAIFLLTNLSFTIITRFLGESYYGFGTFISAVFTMVIALFRIKYFLNHIDYYIFCKNTLWKNNK